MEYIVVQAGGKGSRMLGLTRNKPKPLVPVNNLPMLFHLFRKFPDKKFIIIGDYLFDVLKRYLRAFATVDYRMVNASGHIGTCAGLAKAFSLIPDGERFMLIWSDLILPEDYEIPDSEENIIGISKDFPCRWMYKNDRFSEIRSCEQGVAGLFIFHDKSLLEDVPAEGEFVRWLQSKDYTFVEQPLYRTREYGIYSEWEKLPKTRCRPFNQITVEDGRVIKRALDAQGRALARREIAWYQQLANYHFPNLPQIFSYEPLCMEEVNGQNIYAYQDISKEKKREILCQIISCLKEVHALGSIPTDAESYHNAYIGKTFDRLEKVRDLVPFADKETVTVNGRICRNIFFYREKVEKMVMEYLPTSFQLIHGDCTFSNILLREDTEPEQPVLIDPRGYFGTTELYGDPAYDWVKLYYSLVSNYDQFNLKKFSLEIREQDVILEISSSHWEDMEGEFFHLLEGDVTFRQMRLFLAITWLSLTTYAWEDYDSICGAFYQGLYYLEEVL